MPRRVETVLKELTDGYELLKQKTAHDAKSHEVAELIAKFATDAVTFLSSCRRVELISRVPDKKYFAFNIPRTEKISRSVNLDLFNSDTAKYMNHFLQGTLRRVPFAERNQLLYTLAIAYCCAADLLKQGDQKTPATFFECFIGHLLAREFNVNPKTQVEVLKLEEEKGTLPTDLVFDLGKAKPKFHVPVKTSTRERVIQVFAHQRVLDGVHGFGSFRGILVCLAETKLDHRSKEVVEICVPKQWTLYHKFIAPMHRFYYFDVPRKYEALAAGDPPMAVMPFAKFFDEVEELAAGR
jgi:hypothetical protein